MDDSEVIEGGDIEKTYTNVEHRWDGNVGIVQQYNKTFEVTNSMSIEDTLCLIHESGEIDPNYGYEYTTVLEVSGLGLNKEEIVSIKAFKMSDDNTLTLTFKGQNQSILLTQLQETLSANPEATNSLRTYYINNNNELRREHAEDYGKTYEAIKEGDYIKVRVEKVKKTYQPVPDSGNPRDGIVDENAEDGWRYTWKPTSDPNIYEIDYTDTWEFPDEDKYSYFRLSVNPDLGTEWMPVSSIVLDGENNRALGNNSIVAGKDNTANGGKAAVFGNGNYANYTGFAAGRDNKVLEKSGFAAGEKNINKGYGSAILGGHNEIGEEHTYSAAIGQYLKTHNGGEAVVGQYNQATHDKGVALSVGGGWSEATRRDAMTVYKDGTTKVLGDVYSKDINVTQTAKNAKSSADSAAAAANEAKTLANQANTDITSLENAVEIMNDRLTADVDELYEFSKNIKDDRTTLQLGELPEKGVVDKLYITDDSE